jgi:NodT family efflux transporter outer membrane factor (OMF) lipoprotein
MSVMALAAALAAGACTLEGAKPAPPTLPAEFEHAGATAPWPDADWYRGFASSELDSLIALAEKNSLDVAAAVARVKQADARARQAGAVLLPQVDANGNVAYFAGGVNSATAHETDWGALLSASYEVDFWGKNRAAVQSSQALAGVSRAELTVVRITLSNSVAASYFQVLSLRERIVLARLNVDAARGILNFTEARYQAGSIGPAELAAQRAAVANSELVVPELQRQESEARSALALLVGRAPEGFSVSAENLDALEEPPVAAGLPSDLLKRRPDLIAAEGNLESAHADLTVARAAMFPSLNLTVNGGVQSPAVQAAVITLAGTGWSLTAGASLVQTIFDSGRRRGAVDEAAARQEELVAEYHSSILAALVDVENALTARQYLEQQRDAQHRNADQSERAFQGAELRYREGVGEYLAVLEAQRTLDAARDQLSQYKLERLKALLGLCRALGGGWQVPG